MSATSDLVTSIINNAIATAATEQTAITNYSNQAIQAAQGYSQTNPPSISFVPTLPTIPQVYVPANALGIDMGLFGQHLSIEQFLSSTFSNFFTTYFPADNGYMTAAQNWILTALTGTGTGLSPAAEAQIWQRDQNRILQDNTRAEQDILAMFAARNFPLPPGPALYATYVTQQKSRDLVSESSRAMAIKQAEIEVENVRLAVKIAIEYRMTAIKTAAEYMRTLALGYELAVQLSTAAINAQSNLINAASNYYRALLEPENLRLRALETSGHLTLGGQVADVTAFTARSHNMATAASAAAAAAGQIAGAAFNALHSQATIQSTENL